MSHMIQMDYDADYPAKMGEFSTFQFEPGTEYCLAELESKGYEKVIVFKCVDGLKVILRIPEEQRK